MHSIGLYIHFPFAFESAIIVIFLHFRDGRMDNSLYQCLVQELQEWKGKLTDYRVQTIYLGGGTPTLIPAEQIAYVLNLCTSIFHVEDDAEITIEANPGTVSKEQLSVLKDSGVNRLSIGLQAWQERHLQTLGRIHRNKDLLYSVDFARDAGLYNISIDVMFGLPGQTVDEWLETLYRVCMLGIEHVSTYSLKVEEGTLLYTWLNRLISLPTQEEDRSMYYRGRDYLHQHGLNSTKFLILLYPGENAFIILSIGIMANILIWKRSHSFFNKERFSNYKGIKNILMQL